MTHPSNKRLFFWSILATLLSFSLHAATVDVILMGGQSNCDGRGYTKKLPENLRTPQENVRFFHGNGGGNCQTTCPPNQWISLRPGSATRKKQESQFGPEISMGKKLAESFPERSFHIIKLTKGGTNLHSQWNPEGGELHGKFVETVDAGLAALKAEGKTPRIVAMIWHQGESDCQKAEHANAYQKNLAALITDVRSRYGRDLPFILGCLSDKQKLNAEFRTAVKTAQEKTPTVVAYCRSFSTDDLPLQKDQLHYATEGVLTMGERFAEQVAIYVPERPIVNLWPNLPPNDWKANGEEMAIRSGSVTRHSNVSTPTLKIYPAQKTPTGQAVIVAPGGGYKKLAYDKEGEEIAEFLSSQGITAFALKYRLPKKGAVKHLVPLQDAQRAISFVRANAKRYGIDPDKIGFMGFSAGGHLAAVTSTAATRSYKPIDDVDQASYLPNFSIFIYPAYFLNKKTDTTLKPPIAVTSKTPPAFFAHCKDDRIPFQNSVVYGAELAKHDINNEVHVYDTGGHGFGMRPRGMAIDEWPKKLAAWLKKH